ncbi:MAG: HAD hydrolase family protein [Micropruina sp.]
MGAQRPDGRDRRRDPAPAAGQPTVDGLDRGGRRHESTKWHALERVLRHYDVEPAHVLGAGDGGNDVGWLSRIGLPVAMGNARPEVHAVARGVAPSNADDGAAHLLERLAAVREPDRGRRGDPREVAREGDYLLATYALELPDVDPWARVARFAVGQTTGTWVDVPGLTPELRSAHEAGSSRCCRCRPPTPPATPPTPRSATWRPSRCRRSTSARPCRSC